MPPAAIHVFAATPNRRPAEAACHACRGPLGADPVQVREGKRAEWNCRSCFELLRIVQRAMEARAFVREWMASGSAA